MTWRDWTVLGGVCGFLAVVAGSFGAHGLKGRVTPDSLAVFETAAKYQMYHGLALLAVGLLGQQGALPGLTLAGWSFLIGVVLFSGSLYALTLTGAKWFGAITPLGGVAFLVGWIALAVAAWRSPR